MQRLIYFFTLGFVFNLGLNLGCQASSSGVCDDLKEGLDYRNKSLEELKAEFAVNYKTMLKFEKSCEASGEEIALNAAKVSQAEGCESENEISKMDSMLKESSHSCVTSFSSVTTRFKEIYHASEPGRSDLAKALEFLKKSKYLRKLCGKEVKQVVATDGEYRNLRTRLVGSAKHSSENTVNYRRVKKSSTSMEALTASYHQRCGSQRGLASQAAVIGAVAGGSASGFTKTASDVSKRREWNK